MPAKRSYTLFLSQLVRASHQGLCHSGIPWYLSNRRDLWAPVNLNERAVLRSYTNVRNGLIYR